MRIRKSLIRIVLIVVVLVVIFGKDKIIKLYNDIKYSISNGVTLPDADDIVDTISNISENTDAFVGKALENIVSSNSSNNNVSLIDITETDNDLTLIPVKLLSVIDGDTIRVKKEDTEVKVRLIGINTEESVHSDTSKNNEFGLAASDYLKEYLKGTETLFLEYDLEKTDQYGRELSYVWLKDNIEEIKNSLNGIMVSNGYAYVTIYEPNIRYMTEFNVLEESAKKNKTGLWKEDRFAEIALKHKSQ